MHIQQLILRGSIQNHTQGKQINYDQLDNRKVIYIEGMGLFLLAFYIVLKKQS
jgi:hypothetical protein